MPFIITKTAERLHLRAHARSILSGINQENMVSSKDGGKSIAGALGWGALGSVLGPVGTVAGLVFGGRKPQIITTDTNISIDTINEGISILPKP